jgi:hypothetical protein
MESWRKVWRVGFAPELSTAELEHLAQALRTDDKRLIQHATTCPPPMSCVLDWPCDGACASVIGGWLAGDYETVGDAEERFAKLAFNADQRLKEPAACRFFLNWYDDAPRDEMRTLLLPEVIRELASRSPAPLSEAFPEAVAALAKGA